MSDPDHPTFADSAADCLDALLGEEEALRSLLADIENVSAIPPAPRAAS